MIPIELREHFPDVIDDELWKLSVMILDHKAEELAIAVVHDVADLFLERKRCQVLNFESVVFILEHEDFVLDLVCLFDFGLYILLQISCLRVTSIQLVQSGILFLDDSTHDDNCIRIQSKSEEI